MITAVANLLRADSTFMSYLPGGLYDSVEEVSRQLTPAAFDADGRLKPSGLVNGSTVTNIARVPRAARQVIRLFLYQRGTTTTIEPARRRAYDLLHQQQVTLGAGEGFLYEIVHLDDVLGARDDALGCNLILSRYAAPIRR